MLKGYCAWTKWRQIDDDAIRITLIEQLMGGTISTQNFAKRCGIEYDWWLCKTEVSKCLGMEGQPWAAVQKEYPKLTTRSMMERCAIDIYHVSLVLDFAEVSLGHSD